MRTKKNKIRLSLDDTGTTNVWVQMVMQLHITFVFVWGNAYYYLGQIYA